MVVFLVVAPGERAPEEQLTVPVSLHLPERVTSLAFKVSVLAGAVDLPLLTSPRGVEVTAHRTNGKGDVVLAGPHRFGPSDTEQRWEPLLTVASSGEYSVSVLDADAGVALDTLVVRIEVIGDDFAF